MSEVSILPESVADVAAIHAVTAAAFLEAPHAAHTEQFIVAALRRAGALAVSLVAEEGGAIIGHVAASPVNISGGASGWYGIGPISVLPARQGAGIGTRLMAAALQQLRTQGASGCVLLGDPGWYARFGFMPVPGLVLPDVPPEYFQALAFGDSLPAGVVTYHAGFGATA